MISPYPTRPPHPRGGCEKPLAHGRHRRADRTPHKAGAKPPACVCHERADRDPAQGRGERGMRASRARLPHPARGGGAAASGVPGGRPLGRYRGPRRSRSKISEQGDPPRAPGRTRTDTMALLGSLPLPLGYRGGVIISSQGPTAARHFTGCGYTAGSGQFHKSCQDAPMARAAGARASSHPGLPRRTPFRRSRSPWTVRRRVRIPCAAVPVRRGRRFRGGRRARASSPW